MIIFNSIKNKKWSGNNFEITKSGSLLISSNGSMCHDIALQPGEYNLRIILKKISGEGKCNFFIQSSSTPLLNESIDIPDKKPFELVKNFEVISNINGKLFIKKVENTVGRIEVLSIKIQKIKGFQDQIRVFSEKNKINNKNILSLIVFDEAKINEEIIEDIKTKNKKYDLKLFIFNKNNNFLKKEYNIPVKYFFDKKLFFEYLDLFSYDSFVFFDKNDYDDIGTKLSIKKAIIYNHLGTIIEVAIKNKILFDGYLI